ncbi:unnamed protein product [Symbiodinium sp. KB8]|nr:unnamed protein product [Symbiodinium sp. KB8]
MSSPKRPQSLAVPGNPTCLGGCGRVTSWFLLSPAQRLWTCRPRSCNLRKPQRALTVDTEDLPVFGPATCFTRQPALMPVFEPLLACAHLFPSSVYAAMPA